MSKQKKPLPIDEQAEARRRVEDIEKSGKPLTDIERRFLMTVKNGLDEGAELHESAIENLYRIHRKAML